MIKFIVRYKWKLVGLVIGALAGFAYWYYVGCNSGTCIIQSHWYTSTLYGAVIGYLIPKNPNNLIVEKNKKAN